MMTRIKTLMIWIGLLLSLASCKDSIEAITLGGDELPTEGVTLSIQLPNFTPQEISTRAGGETTESITSLWLVCYDTSDNYLDMQDCTKAYADATADKDGYKKIKTNLPKGTETVHLVANVPGLTEAQAEKLDAMEVITPNLSKPICWGKAKLSDLMNDSKISLTRQCAKVTVQTSVSGFEITDLHVWHSASKGSIAPAGYVESTNDNLVTSTELMDDSKCIAGGSAVVAVNETSAGKADIIIKAKYKGTEGTEGFYKVALYKDDTKTAQYALVRNHNYIVKVISVNDAGYATEAEALKAQPENRLKVTVVDDNPEIVDMIACKDYELGVCGTQPVDASSTTAPITLFTNLKPENTTDNNLYKVEISKDAQSWITSWSPGSQSTTTSPNESAPKGTKFVLNLTLTANNKSEEPREGTITITSGDLKRTITIHQKGYDFKRANLLIMKEDETNKNVLAAYKTVKGNHAANMTNLREIEVIKQEVIPELKDICLDEIGIITPYNNQVNAIRQQLPDIEVGTVHKFQGREKDVIIMSVVSNQINDFIDDPHLINVAVSRAKKKFYLVVTGNEQEKTSNIKDLIDYIDYNNCKVVDSKVFSIFDYLYSQYTDMRIAFLESHPKISEYASENIAYSLIKSILESDRKYSCLHVLCHIPLRSIFRQTDLMSEEERIYAGNFNTHVDFLIINRATKQPLLGIEIDGYAYHHKGTVQSSRDALKDHIFKSYHLQLLRLSTKGANEEEKVKERLDTIC